MPLVGGLGELKPADDTVHGIVAKVKEQLGTKVAEKRPSFAASEFNPLAIAYKSQVVAGTNYFIKVKIAEGDFIHIRIYRDLQGNATLHSVTETKTETDEIVYF